MRNIKIFSLAFFAVVLFWADWLLIKTALFTDKNLIFWLWPTIVSALAIVALLFLFISHTKRSFSYLVLGLILAFYLFVMPKDLYVLLGGVVFTGLAVLFEQRIRSEERSRQDFSIRRISNACISVIIYALMLLICFNVYSNTSNDFKAHPDEFYNSLGSAAAKRVPSFTKELTGVNLDQTLDQFITKQVSNESPEFAQLNPQFQTELINEAKEDFFKQFDLRVAGDRKLIEIMTEVAVDRIKETAKDYEVFFPLFFTLIILAFMRLFSFIFKWLTTFVSWVSFRMLLQVGFFRLNKVPVEVEKLEI